MSDKNGELAKGMDAAVAEARRGLTEGGIPIGSALLKDGEIISTGRNRRIQKGSQILHGEMDCIENAGRVHDFSGMTLFTTLSPCMMCSGTIVQFGIRKVVIGENRNFGGNEEFLRQRGVEVEVLDDERCVQIMGEFIEKNKELWYEDIGKVE